jgi:hypothetical protein
VINSTSVSVVNEQVSSPSQKIPVSPVYRSYGRYIQVPANKPLCKLKAIDYSHTWEPEKYQLRSETFVVSKCNCIFLDNQPFHDGMDRWKSAPSWHSRLSEKYLPLNFFGLCQVNLVLHYEILQRSRKDTVVAVCCCLSDSAMALANMWSSSTCCCLFPMVPFGWLLWESWSERANARAKASSSLCGNYYKLYIIPNIKDLSTALFSTI